ncbi:DUF962 domain-containing protein [Gynuella sunshinyii]|uniref:Putative membrane protein n=1 Tax=Gynuella sunshinyii YC6258 TaxID=1445510 RepID=A0A0C5VAM5_9GAMM|nr:Mpo1-like protein [Gynuella sunshinyii]AJQ96385.1 putative membrane protein [Gynuella sunshinyii YC6258]
MFNKPIESWLAEYGESHQNKVNKFIHWICVPVIFWTLLALLWQLQLPQSSYLNLATVLIVYGLFFYAHLSLRLMLGMLIISALSIALILWHERAVTLPLWKTATTLFVGAWIGQFIGHIVEGKRPSFFKDLQFLLIGPAWLMSFIYHRLGIRLK